MITKMKSLKGKGYIMLLLLFGISVIAAGCGDDGAAPAAPAPTYTYALHTMGLVNVIDESTGTVIKSIDTDVDGNGIPGDVNTGGTLGALTPDRKKLYVSNAGADMNTVTVIDTTTLTKIKDITTGGNTTIGSRPKHAIVSPDGKWVGVNHWRCEDNGKLRVSFIKTSTDTVYQNIDLTLTNACTDANQSMHNAWSWDSQYFFTSSYADDKVYVFRTPSYEGGSFTLAAVYDLSISGQNNDPHYMAPSNDNRQMWIVTEGPSGNPYDPTKPDFAPLIYVVNLDSLVIYTPLLPILETGEVIEGHHGNFSLDGKYFYFCNRGPSPFQGVTVDVFDTASWALAARVTTAPLGTNEGDGHAYLSPDGKTVAITKYGTNILTFLDPADNWSQTNLTVGTGIHIGHITFTSDSKKAFCSNRVDGAVYQIDNPGPAAQVSKTIPLVLPDLTTLAGSGTGQVVNDYTNIFEVKGNLFKK